MSKASELKQEMDILEAERTVLTIRLRNALIKEATELLPEAVRQSKPHGSGKKRRPGSPALLRLITRMAMRPLQVERRQP
jgi:hypothetical protein